MGGIAPPLSGCGAKGKLLFQRATLYAVSGEVFNRLQGEIWARKPNLEALKADAALPFGPAYQNLELAII